MLTVNNNNNNNNNILITFIEGIYNYIPETHHVSRVYSVAAVLYSQSMLHVTLFHKLRYVLHFYASTFQIIIINFINIIIIIRSGGPFVLRPQIGLLHQSPADRRVWSIGGMISDTGNREQLEEELAWMTVYRKSPCWFPGNEYGPPGWEAAD